MNLKDQKQRAQLADELRKRLVADGAPSEHLLGYIEFFTRLRTAGRQAGIAGLTGYSRNNLFLLRLQELKNGETHRGLYAGPQQWAKLERTVKADAKPKLIWAPVPVPTNPRSKEIDKIITLADGTTKVVKETVLVASLRYPFRMVEVYDFTDTEGDPALPDPDWAVPMHHGDEATYQRLLTTSPIPVREENLAGAGAHGRLDRYGIVVDIDQPAGNRLGTLVHELAHFHLKHLDKIRAEGETVRAACEQEAELAVFLFFTALGLGEGVGNDLTTATLDYLRSWIKDGNTVAGHKARVELLGERLENAWTAVEKMLAEVDALQPV
jgi:hypothetical protein